MSVVNKMLRDLEKRQSSQISADYVASENTRNKKLMFSMLIVSLLAVTASVGYVKFYTSENEVNSRPVQPATQDLEFAPDKGDQIAYVDANGPAKAELIPVSEPEIQVADIPEPVKTDKPEIVEAALATELNDVQLQTAEMTSTETKVAAISEVQKQPQSLSIAPSSGHSKTVSSLKEQARFALDSKDTLTAIDKLTQVLSMAPDDKSVIKQLASLQYAQNQVSQATQTLHIGLQRFPTDSAMRLMQARIAFRQGDALGAMTVLEQHPNSHQATNDLLSFRAALAEKSGQYQSAFNDYKILVSRESTNAKWWLGLAVCQDKLSLSKEALASYQQVQVLNQLPTQVHSFVNQRIEFLARQS
ncbi:tetratricopeptide repeat protein [Glaciecola sp. 1036]|uniref:tetratricopeptide repeat protein n=1 Tax=Alteromonadaceae TaxID=72275 RepID=UPI003D090E47